jgi:hypothetical protein
MKSRVFFYCTAIVALVLFLAAVPSHSTERREPFVMQDTTPAQPAKPSGSAHVTASHKKQTNKNAQKQKGTTANSEQKNPTSSAPNAGSIHDGTGSSSAAK